ncbi:MAG: UDP-N-acetylmuramoyl-L-alanine--D-glutamate ligase, partial [Clostridia bacterium]|nr:UDP-N-acetylmuramoyl-L-alanine--D-glutamate ligase [Clostridia bacterium]
PLYDRPDAVVPHRAALTNLSPNHLDWHPDMDDYIRAKTRIFDGARCSLLVTNAKNEHTARLAQEQATRRRVVLFSSDEGADTAVCLRDGMVTCHGEPILPAADIRLPGVHNLENMMTAIALCHGLVPTEAMRRVATEFGGVEHRLQHVRSLRGVDYYNSSIDSSPSRTAAALSALRQPIVVICGGYDKHIPFAPLAEALCARARAVVLTGATALAIRAALDACPAFDEAHLTVVHEPDFADAVKAASSLADEGDAVLLSPACASFDAFPNFAVRGETFCRIVNELP